MGVFVAAGTAPSDCLAPACLEAALVEFRVGAVAEDLVGDLQGDLEEASVGRFGVSQVAATAGT
jgi:hypothetical protein